LETFKISQGYYNSPVKLSKELYTNVYKIKIAEIPVRTKTHLTTISPQEGDGYRAAALLALVRLAGEQSEGQGAAPGGLLWGQWGGDVQTALRVPRSGVIEGEIGSNVSLRDSSISN